jgi:outer membrane immunogenic protein
LKKLLVATTALLAVGMVAPASPADLVARPYTAAPVMAAPAYYDWSGFYIGANGGWGSSRKCFEALPAGTNVLAGTFELTGDEGCHDATGGVAGGQIGYRWQAGSWIFGLEAQGNWADLSGSRLSAAFGNPASGGFIDRTRIDAFGLFTGQIGYAYDSVLLYAKGGAAVTRDRYDIFSTPVPFALPQFGTGSETRWGGAAGVGLEFGFAPGWSIGGIRSPFYGDSGCSHNLQHSGIFPRFAGGHAHRNAVGTYSTRCGPYYGSAELSLRLRQRPGSRPLLNG